ncbi:Nucleoporin [Hanseniaspora osmophila]|uniref:Nucleoporin n=1 Tax=Hanseniaspora osmophila TaxID=56408 RepID=A0A1E5R0C8_9ASCO|nr:Nucleoporin [Hanseniaspora osmophila]
MNYSNNVFDSPGGAKSPFGSRNWNDTPLRKRKDIDGFTRPRGSLKHEYTPTFDSFGPTTPNAKNEGLFASSPNSKTTKQGNNDEQHHSPCKQKKKYNTLISTDVLSVGSQRGLALSIGALIWLYKLYDLIDMKINLPKKDYEFSRLSFIVKFFILDFLYLYSLPVFKIPKLNFKPFVTYFFIVLWVAIDVLISSNSILPFLTLLVSTYSSLNPQKMAISGNTVNYKKITDSSSHFKGKHIIKILPENTALFNPFHDSYCFSEQYGVHNVQVPIRVNSTIDIGFLQFEHRDLYTNKPNLINISTSIKNEAHLIKKIVKHDERLRFLNQDSISNIEKAQSIQYYNVTLSKPGYYQLVKLLDKDNFQLKLYRSNLVVPECPRASFKPVEKNSLEKPSTNLYYDRCLGTEDKISITVNGVPPLQLQYGKRSGQNSIKETVIDDTSLQPPNFLNGDFSPLMAQHAVNKLSKNDISNLKWAQNYDVDIELQSVSKDQGLHGYHIYKIIDGFGNVIQRDILFKNDKNNLDYEYYIHGEPKASLSERINAKSPTKKSLVITLEDFDAQKKLYQHDGPFDVEILYKREGSDDVEIIHQSLQKNKHLEIIAEKSGEYVLNSVNSKFCPGIVLGENRVVVTEPVPPQMKIEATSIQDQCAGPIGLDFNLIFTGVAPFEFTTKIHKINPITGQKTLYESKKRRSMGTRHQFLFNPSQVGDYEIEFVDISNTVFNTPIKLQPLSEYLFKTSMKVKPDAKITNNNSNNNRFNGNFVEKLCLNESRSVSVDLRGEPPFELKYDITETNTNERTFFVAENVMENHLQLATPNFAKGGNYVFSLASVKDSTGCLVPLSGEEVSYNVRRLAPSAEFNFIDEDHQHVIIKAGSSTTLPLRLLGDPPFQIGYQHASPNDKFGAEIKYATITSKVRPSLTLKEQGTYKLVSIQDNACKGFVGSQNSFQISYLPQPKLKVLDHNHGKINKINEFKFLKNDVCEKVEQVIELQIDGLAPLNVTYDVIIPNGHVLKNQYLQVLTNYATIKLPNEKSGEYKIVIKNVNDANYPDTVNMKPIEVIQNVFKKPDLRIFNKNGAKSFRTCYSNIDEPSAYLEKIQLQTVTGNKVGLYAVTFKLFHETSGKTDYFVLETSPKGHGEHGNVLDIDYKQIYGKLKMGTYSLTIDKIVDSVTGCVGKDSSLSSFSITITDVPTISLLEPSLDYCVGDYVAYQLNGQLPFEIKYAFNKKKLKTTEHSSQFIRLASEAGEISINSIQDTQAKCLVNFNKPGMERQFRDLSLNIHGKPTVTTSKGDVFEEDIHEGEQAEIIFTFEGEMPFQLKYVRMENEITSFKDMKNNNVEIFTVSDIYSYEYRFVTSLQGTYEAIEISDKYCTARNEEFYK